MDIYGKSAVEIRKLISEGKISKEEVERYFRERIAKHEEKLNTFVTLAPDDYNSHTPDGPLHGIPIAVKDNYCTKDLRTTASSKVLDNFIPKFESTVTDRLKKAGVSILGKTNMDAWAHGASSETSDYGLTHNPWDLDSIPGGSSSGSAAAVSAYLAPVSLGSDTGGSTRHPASWCGVIGLKPTYGRVSRYGIAAMGSSLDSPGPLALYMEDVALLMEVIAGADPYDATSVNGDVPRYTEEMKKGRKFKIGIAQSFIDDSDPEVADGIVKAIKEIEKLGHEVKPVKILDPKYSISVYTIVQRAEVSSNLARYQGIRYGNDRTAFGKEAKKRSMLGAYVLSHGYADQYYKNAQRLRALISQNFEEIFKDIDLILAPSAPVTAMKIGESEKYPFFGELMDRLNEPASVTGLPAISLPAGLDSKGLPIGLQIIGPKLHESEIMDLSYQYEKATNYFDVIQKGLERWK